MTAEHRTASAAGSAIEGLPGESGGLGKRSDLRHQIPTQGTIISMSVSKVSLSIDEEVLAEARDRAGRRELSSYVTDALRRQLQHDRLGELLAELDATAGPVPDELMEEARQLWRGAVEEPKSRRRSA